MNVAYGFAECVNMQLFAHKLTISTQKVIPVFACFHKSVMGSLNLDFDLRPNTHTHKHELPFLLSGVNAGHLTVALTAGLMDKELICETETSTQYRIKP